MKNRIALLSLLTILLARATPADEGGLTIHPDYVDALGTVPYDLVSQRSQDFTLFNIETTRGMALGQGAGNGGLYAINTHGSQLMRFELFLPGFPKTTWPTLMNPIAVATWGEKVLVLGGATHALAVYSPFGVLERTIDLSAHAPEPGDLVVDNDNDHAYVSSMGRDQVARIDLEDMSTIEVWTVAAGKPRFLFLDRGVPEDLDDNIVYVAPFLSGNNTTFAQQANQSAHTTADNTNRTRIIRLDDALTELPDQDLFAIATDSVPGAAEPVLRRVSTLMTAHGRNPASGEYWMLGVELMNAEGHTEAEHKGVFAHNEVTVTADPRSLVDGDLADLDVVSGATIALDHADKSASAPWDIAFNAALAAGAPGSPGDAFISSPTGDEVWHLNAQGGFVRALQTGPGSIPRSLLLSGPFLAVYCWGTNEILIFGVDEADPVTPLLAPFDLGFDPTPPEVAEGRTVFYDADLSYGARTTCGSCHPGGEYDGLGWGLEAPPKDFKDTMVTQNLKSIADTFPYHWRGERDLIDFKPAFVDLLGMTAPVTTADQEKFDAEFEALEHFIFALQSPANPNAMLTASCRSRAARTPLRTARRRSRKTSMEPTYRPRSD